MSWKKFCKPVNSVLPASQREINGMSPSYASTAKYSNWLPEVYAGPPDRLQRYAVYDQMNFDHEIHAALDTITDFGTEADAVTELPLVLKFNEEPTPSEIQILEKTLGQWCRLNKVERRLWSMFRSTLVYGDQFFLRDPETFKLYWIDPAKVEKVIVNESNGKKIESYFIKDIDLNIKGLVATNQLNKLSNEAFGSNSIVFSPPMQGNMNYVSGGYGGAGTANYQDGGATAVDAEHIVQLSLSDGMNAAWPFGLSILEQIYKVYKQKELLEDAILIYRVHRAPERRMFFVDVGSMPPNKAQAYLEKVKYEVQQKRIPSRTGGGGNVSDSTYNPLCLDMSTRVPLLDGRTLTITELAEEYKNGKENWVYSQDMDQCLEPAKIVWAGITRKDAQVIRVYIDNETFVDATPDHRFIMRDGSEREAQFLQPNDLLMPLYDKDHKVVKIEWLTERVDTGDITVEGKSNSHIFALDCGIFVHNSILEDYYFAVSSDGNRGSRVEVLPGGENLGSIDDLRYFNNKMLRALGVPSSYLPTGPEDGTSTVSDGRVGSAFIQEFRFSKVVARYQQQIIEPIDLEFKLFLKRRGVTIDNSLFELAFTPVQSFSEYRQLELDSARINTFTALTDISFVSKRYILKRYLGWTEGELNENERMWKEERSRLTKTFAPEQTSGGGGGSMGGGSAPAGLSDIGITSSGIDDMSGGEEIEGQEESPTTDNEVDNFGEQ